MPDIAEQLEAFLRREAERAPYPGACCRLVDRWITARTGQSALLRFGRDFETDEDVRRWLSEPGGIAVAVNRVMRACGYPKTKEPKVGDVGLVFHGGLMAMAILTGGGWAGCGDSGLFCVPQHWKAWSIR